ncbi:Alstrom syndrome protein 1 [Oryzias melastigma]|uniref:Alstrom syndrome protein 1 n=1 Tax=Oryzias melastigma TaxID=30732 RepID=A0A834F4E0_ORYME|nr:Alstrom syndrome protein 1 [Oryzias melastigma]
MDLQEVAAGDGRQVLSRPGTPSPSHSISNQDQTQPPLGPGGSQPLGGHDPQLDFQDSSLSPALRLLPAASGMEPSLSDLTHAEFAPLRACPDFSMISQEDSTHQAGGGAPYPSYPVQSTVLSDRGRSSWCTLSEHSMSPTNQYKLKERLPPDKTAGANRDSSSGEADLHDGGAAEGKMPLQGDQVKGPGASGPDQLNVSGGVDSLLQPPASSAHAPSPSSGGEAEAGADLWPPGNQKKLFLAFLPQSQSTPGGVMIPPGSRSQTGVGRALHPPSQVPALPSLTYVQKVDAWRAGQSIGLGGLSRTVSEPSPLTCVLPFRSQQPPQFAADPDSFSGLQVGPSVDASSAPSLELESFSPYMTSKGSSPPPSPKPPQPHLDKDNSICNLEIDHAPLTILTSMTPRGPNQDPKLSPTIKGSTATPLESSQPSEGGILVKQDFSKEVTESVVKVDSPLDARRTYRGGGEDSTFSSTAGLGLRGQVSTGLPAASSAPLLSEDRPALVQMEARKLQGSSAPPSSAAADPWRMGARSHSDPTLSLKEPRQSHPPTPSLHLSTATPTCPSHHKAEGEAAGGSRLLCDAARRTEPEGCSAAPPKKVLTSRVSAGPPSASTQQLSHQGGLPRDDEEPGQAEPPSLTTPDADLLSDGSSDSSLTIRVAKLLQDDPASTTLSSPPSTAEQDSRERKACCRQPLQLHEEDRRGVEEVKRELLLKGEGSTDTGGSSDTGGAAAFNPAEDRFGFSVPPPDNLFKPLLKGCPSTSSASPPSMATLGPSVKKRQQEGGATSAQSIQKSDFDPPWSHSVSQKRVETVLGQHKEPPLSETSSASDVSREGGQSSAAGTQRVLTPQTSAHNLPSAGTAFRRLSASSPDGGMGSSRPAGGWDHGEQQMPESSRFQRGEFSSTAHLRGAAASPPLFKQTPAVPMLRPYKPPGSDELFYIPDREASASPASTMESSHPGSDDAVPPPFGSDILGQQDPGLEAGVTFRHAEGIYSKRVNSFNMQTDTPAHPSPPKSQLPPSTNGQVLRREQRVGLHRSPHPEQTGPDHTAHSLDLLWQKFCEALGGSGPACSREASLVERLQRLSQLIHSMGGLQGEQSRGERGGHGTEPQRRVWASREDRAEEALQGVDSVQSLLSWSSSLVHTEGTETPSPGSDSSIDTQRLIRVYGAHRVQKMKNGAIHRQKRGVTHRTTPPSAPPPLGPTEDRESARHRACSTSEGRSKDTQAGNIRTRPLTRDVGTTFPSPGDARSFGQTSSSSSSTVRGGGTPPKFQTSSRRGKSRRSPPQAHPGGVSWFISADTLRSEERKENRPESAAWFQHWSRVEPWREPLRLRQVQQDRRRQQTVPEPEPKARSLSSTGGPISLQEALRVRRPDFIIQSRQRMRRLDLQAQERRLLSLEGAFCYQTGAPVRLRTPAGPLLRRAVPRKEMIQRSKRIYENLPEVQRRKEEERRKAEYRSYRLNALLYNKRITERVLGRRSAWR